MEQDKIQDLTYDLYTDGSRAWKAVDDLVTIGKPAVPHLIKALKLRNNDRRFSVVSALGKIGDPSAIKALSIVAAKDKSWKVRKEAGDAIKQLSAD